MNIKLLIILAAIALQVPSASAQGWRQRMLEQIAALKVNLSYLKKGYQVVGKGTKVIGDLKSGEFNLHRNFFDSMVVVNPRIAGDKRIADMLRMYDAMEQSRKSLLKTCDETGLVSPAEYQAVETLLQNLAADIEAEIQHLELVITSGKLELTDDERIAHIGACYRRVLSMYSFQRKSYRNMLSLLQVRGSVLKDAAIMRQLHDLKQAGF